MTCEHFSRRRVEFSETDMAGLVHFSCFYRYMELAERDFFEACGLNLIETEPGKVTGWPRARSECKFLAPLKFPDWVWIHLAVSALKERAVEYQFRIYREEKDGNLTQAAKGRMTTVYTTMHSSGELHSLPLPSEVLQTVEETPNTVLRRRLETIDDLPDYT